MQKAAIFRAVFGGQPSGNRYFLFAAQPRGVRRTIGKKPQRNERKKQSGRSFKQKEPLPAAKTGYADQAHLTRESTRLAGLSPAALARVRHHGLIKLGIEET